MLASDATLLTIRDAVPVEYVRQVLENVRVCEREMGDARVCIAVNDLKPHPSYLIRAVMDLETEEGMLVMELDGMRHRPLNEKQLRALIWSTSEITYDDVRRLIGSMRNFKVKPRKAT